MAAGSALDHLLETESLSDMNNANPFLDSYVLQLQTTLNLQNIFIQQNCDNFF